MGINLDWCIQVAKRLEAAPDVKPIIVFLEQTRCAVKNAHQERQFSRID